MLTAAMIATAATATATQAQPMTYPETRKVEQVDTYHGTKVADPYRWLEDDNSAETKEWVKAQNAITNRYPGNVAAAICRRRKLYTDLYNFEKIGIPFSEGGKYFYTRNDGLQQQSVCCTW